MLELPNFVKLFVKKIDYKSEVIEVYDPDHCFPRQLRGLNLTSSPFLFTKESFYQLDYALFNCSSKIHSYKISCLSGPSHEVRAFHSGYNINDLPISSCKKMYTLPSIPYGIIEGYDKVLQLKWSISVCRHCEVKGMGCRLKNNNSSESETECFPKHTKIMECRLKKNGSESETECFPKHNKGALLETKITGTVAGSFSIVLAIFTLYRVYRYDKVEKENQENVKNFLEDYKNFKPTRYSYVDIKRITNQFIEKLGEGANGTVFKGKLSYELHVAVKILKTCKENWKEFINEVETIGRIHHVNVVRLVGFCADGVHQALVYEFLPNYSLEKFISSTNTKNRILSWDKLQDIAIGIAKGIDYLHQGCDQRILHFDIKPHNVLLDKNFNPKISDFGLAKLCSKDQSAVSITTVKGTIGYIAPEVFSRNFGNVSYKSDVYSFGILLLEIVGGRKNVDLTTENVSQVYFPEWIYNFLEQKEDLRIFIDDDGENKIAKKLAIVGLWCIQWHPVDRPPMKVVIQMLEGVHELNMPPNPFASTSPTRMNPNMLARRLNPKLDVIPE